MSGDNSRPLRICLVSPCPPPLGGMAIQSGKLFSCLESENVRVEIIRTNSIFTTIFSWVGRIPFVRTLLNSILFLTHLNRSLSQCEIVYFLTGFFNFFFWITLPGILLIKLRGRKLVLNARGGGAAEFFRQWKYIVYPVIRKADMITTPSGFLKDVFIRHLGLEPKIVPNIADFNQFKFRKRERFEPRFIVTRSLEDIYNVECVLKAFQKIHEKIPDSRIDILGDGSLRRDLEGKVKRWGLEESVIFHGVVPHSRIQEYYQKNDIFLNASNVDNLPGTILEAFACGLPVISTKAGGIPYMVEDGKTGLLVEKNDHEAMAENALFLIENQETAADLAKKARKECEKYSAEAVRTVLISIFERLQDKGV